MAAEIFWALLLAAVLAGLWVALIDLWARLAERRGARQLGDHLGRDLPDRPHPSRPSHAISVGRLVALRHWNRRE